MYNRKAQKGGGLIAPKTQSPPTPATPLNQHKQLAGACPPPKITQPR